jgi:FdhD protein
MMHGLSGQADSKVNNNTVNPLVEIEILKITEDGKESVIDVAIHETQVLFRINGNLYRTFYCIPHHLEDMVRGHVVSEGLSQFSGIKEIQVTREKDDTFIEATIDLLNLKLNTVTSKKRINSADIRVATVNLDQHSTLFRHTGGAHIAGIFNSQLLIFAEDVSRHCAIDKAIGLALQEKLDITQAMLLTSCRQTASTISKAIHTEIPIVISTSAVSSLAIESAEKYGITLIGFARKRRFNVYSHKERIINND